MEQLAPHVRNEEPHAALHAGEHGTEVIEPLIRQAAERLEPGGALLVEVSPMIAAKVEQLLHDTPEFQIEPTMRDVANHPRVVQATRQVD